MTNRLRLDKEYDGFKFQTQSELDAEGGYWIKTDYTKGEWWAWSNFRIA